MRTLLITGGAGFIGSNLVLFVLEHTVDRVAVVDRLTYAANPLAMETWVGHPRVAFIQGDIADHDCMSRVVETHKPAAILNLAAETHVDRSIDSPRAFVDTNVRGTLALLEIARRYMASLPEPERRSFRFLHVSTDEVYGTLGPGDARFREETRYAPNSPYAASKAGADHLVRAYHQTYGLPTLITNCSNNYGPFQHPEKLIPLTILNALDGRPLPIYGDGRHIRDWLHVEDHCEALMRVLARGAPGESYNIGADNDQTNIAIVDRICHALEELLPSAHNEALRAAGVPGYGALKQCVPDRPGHDRRYSVDATKLRRELGWTPRRAFEEGLPDTVSWYMAHREWYRAERVGYDRQRLGLQAGGLRP